MTQSTQSQPLSQKILSPIRYLYDQTLSLASSKYAVYWLALVAFSESIFFPIPQDIMLIPMILAVRERAFLLAGVCTVASVSGGIVGYGVGLWFYETMGQAVIAFYGLAHKVTAFKELFAIHGFSIVFAGGFTPIPYKVITLTSGAMNMDFGTFILASAVSRGLRFFLIAWLLWKFGETIKNFIDRYFGVLTLAGTLILIGGFALIRYV